MDFINKFFDEFGDEDFDWGRFEKKFYVEMLVALHKATRIDLNKKKDKGNSTYTESLEASLEFAWPYQEKFYKGAIRFLNSVLKKN